MGDDGRRPRIGLPAVALLLATLLAGCTQTEPDLATPMPRPAQPAPDRAPTSGRSLLLYARRLADTTARGREAAVRHARDEVRRAPEPLAYAHLALALAAPHQRLYTPDEAARYAELASAADPSPWSPDAAQYLDDMAHWLTLATERDNADDDRIDALQSQLDDARQKIDALSNIEGQIDHGTTP